MKKNTINKKKIGKYKTGGTVSDMDKANAIGQAAQFAGTQLGQMFDGLENGKQASVGSTLTGLGGGAASGAAIGTMLAPGIGTAIGAGAGALIGGIAGGMGSGGSVNELTGEYTMPSGIAGMFGHSKGYIRRKTNTIRTGIQSEVDSNRLAADYYSENGYNMPTMAAKGGIIPNTLAYLDDGELIRTPDGQIGAIPEEGKPEDSNLTNVPVGTQVLSDKLKVPGTNKTFAEMGKKLINKKGKGKGIYAQNSQMLNDRNNQMKYNQLLAMQENMKNSGSQSKKGIIKAAKGTPYIDSIDQQELMRFKGITPYVETPTATTKVAGVIDIPKIKIPEQYTTKGHVSNVNANRQSQFNYFNDLAGDISQLALPMSKAFNKAKSDKVNAYSYTPQFLPTDYDINPQLSEIDRSYAMSRYNQANISPNTGAGMAFGLQSAVARNNAMNNLYSQKYNTQNQLRAQNANIYNQWGNQYANAQHIASVEQAQNDTAAKQYNNQALTELSTTLQSMRKDKRLTKRDQVMLEYMKDYLGYGTKDNTLTALINGFK